MDSLFGHLAPKFASKPEDLATEALTYILGKSDSGRIAFIEHVNRELGTDFPQDLQFSSHRSGDSGGIPDMQGDANGQRLLVEVKFWAGLTGPQTRGYHGELEKSSKGGCVFLVPEKRVEHIQRKLGNTLDVAEPTDPLPFQIQGGYKVGVTDWSTVLDIIESAVQASTENGRHYVLNDIHQLRGLCEKLDADAFHPLHADELGPEVARRMIDLRKLVNDLRKVVKKDDDFSSWQVDGRMKRRTTVYRFVGSLYGSKWFLGIFYDRWNDQEVSPFWIKFVDGNQERRQKIREALRGKVTVHKHPNPNKTHHILMPLTLEHGVERREVIANLKEQLKTIEEFLAPALRQEE